MKWLLILVGLFIAIASMPLSFAQDVVPLSQLTPPAIVEATPKAIAATSPPFFGWDDGFFLRSADKQFSLRITGQLQADYRWYVNPRDERDFDGFLIRRARFGLEATMFKYYEFRFLPEFGSGTTRLVDGFMNVHYIDSFQVMAGKFKQPFSYEQLTQDRNTPTMERSMIDQLVPARDVGVMAHGQNLFQKRLDYGLAVSNGTRDGDADTNNSKDVNARVAVRPFATRDGSLFQRLQFGIATGYGNQREPVNPTSLRTPDGVTFLQFNNGVLADGGRFRVSPEVAYFGGSLGISAQYFHMTQRLRTATGVSQQIPFDGFYAQATYLLTGEERTSYTQQIAPRRPFDPVTGAGFGAWELVSRVSRIEASDRIFANRLADPTTVSNGATEMTLGYNWYLNKWTRIQFNWEHVWFDRKVKLGNGPNGLLNSQDTLLTRLQFVF